MNWIDIRVRKPTQKDAESSGRVICLLENGDTTLQFWDKVFIGQTSAVAWLDPKTLPKFTPIPDPPEGYRWKQDGDEFDKRAMVWCPQDSVWAPTICNYAYVSTETYTVPIDPPKPQYRRFENAAEFEPFADRWVRCKPEKCETYRICAYNDQLFWMGTAVKGVSFEAGLRDYCFSDGTPFGLPVE
jgi:hypothetical protein